MGALEKPLRDETLNARTKGSWQGQADDVRGADDAGLLAAQRHTGTRQRAPFALATHRAAASVASYEARSTRRAKGSQSSRRVVGAYAHGSADANTSSPNAARRPPPSSAAYTESGQFARSCEARRRGAGVGTG